MDVLHKYRPRTSRLIYFVAEARSVDCQLHRLALGQHLEQLEYEHAFFQLGFGQGLDADHMACDADGQLRAADAGHVEESRLVRVGIGMDAFCLYDGPSSVQEN